MREKWAKFVVVFTGLLVVLLAYVFADIQNPVDRSLDKKTMSPELNVQRLSAGRKVFKESGCMNCHSVAGEGNPRSLLDGVGAKLSAKELRDWVLGAKVLRGKVSASVLTTKQHYENIPQVQFDDLIYYLQSLK